MIALLLDKENRVMDLLPAETAPEKYPRVEDDKVPKGFIDHYIYLGNGEFQHKPLGDTDVTPTADEIINALLGVE